VSRITPSSTGGQRNWPPSKRFARLCRPTTIASRDRPVCCGTRRPRPNRDRRRATLALARRACRPAFEIHGPPRHQNQQLRPGQHHDALRTARSTAMSSPVSVWPRTRTIASLIAISMRPRITVSAGGEGGAAEAGDDVADAITTGAKAGSGPGHPRGFALPLLGRGYGHGSGAARPAGALLTAHAPAAASRTIAAG
jgi:hypothetical protein